MEDAENTKNVPKGSRRTIDRTLEDDGFTTMKLSDLKL